MYIKLWTKGTSEQMGFEMFFESDCDCHNISTEGKTSGCVRSSSLPNWRQVEGNDDNGI